jgi:hypothetical protein
MKKIKQFLLPFLLAIAIGITITNLIACSKDDAVGDGSECSYCNTDADCRDGMTCEFFYDNNPMQQKSANLCAYSYTSSCDF